MTCRPRFYKVQYRDFSRKTVTKYWREGSLVSARRKALNQGNCLDVLSVTELTEQQYQAEATASRKTTQFLRNTSR